MPEITIEWGEGPPSDAFAAAAREGYPPEPLLEPVRWAVASRGGVPAARLSTMLRTDLHGAPGASGLIGHYAARDDEAGIALLRAAAGRLRDAHVVRVLGPMNGTTWARYRLALPAEPGDPREPPFLGEPVNPPEYCRHFTEAGFHVAARYESRITPDIAVGNARAAAAEDAAAARGVRVAPLDPARFEAELADLHALSVTAFAGNPYYTPIDLESFRAMYRPMRASLDPGLVLIARASEAEVVGYVFAYADPLGLMDGRPYRLIVKTLAVAPGWRSFGLGALLVERLHVAARARGLRAVVHALMHAANDSVKISTHTAQVFRRYALYELT